MVNFVGAGIYLIGTVAFIALLVKAFKDRQKLPKLLCLLLILTYGLSAISYFGDSVRLENLKYWVYCLCMPQALILITYLLYNMMVGLDPNPHQE